jgi:hypothetical protein
LTFSTALLIGTGEKLGMDPQIGRPTCWGFCWEPFFLEVVTVNDSQNVAICGPCETRMVDGHTRTERGKRVACWPGFSCMVYIDSNHRDSRI